MLQEGDRIEISAKAGAMSTIIQTMTEDVGEPGTAIDAMRTFEALSLPFPGPHNNPGLIQLNMGIVFVASGQ